MNTEKFDQQHPPDSYNAWLDSLPPFTLPQEQEDNKETQEQYNTP